MSVPIHKHKFFRPKHNQFKWFQCFWCCAFPPLSIDIRCRPHRQIKPVSANIPSGMPHFVAGQILSILEHR
ncbi:hypothetical protein CCACVL1_30867 [Corchorus capsularis]|uniref:Uncharacterized protein n=1 Tax=Corchorus capsularis TaxID=210143 RepID=A0A1R3FV06_COCAP|nr:hypothetical protein CCACVL1_30867 [Corchorus capsularis]